MTHFFSLSASKIIFKIERRVAEMRKSDKEALHHCSLKLAEILEKNS